uniref:Cycloeucalenol cycloisomerase n=1 Tax=Palpitomonas bilix TaxID=652834 RepID=A0A7S3D735_9EUKA|mmetsp:Transcript_25224/g.63289  ORF Transcript_25224/g.63289 Transcript_25224/m.63289 type:complete len:269 (+) Transcript_25224:110-916(+)
MGSETKGPMWFSSRADKRWSEKFFLLYAPFWIGVMAVIVATGVYESMGDWEYLYVGLVCSIPAVVLPFLLAPDAQTAATAWKSNVWIFCLAFVGNFLWTHYFYTQLGAKYTFQMEHRLNDVPLTCYLLTQPYFLMYHTVATLALRRIKTSTSMSGATKLVVTVIAVCLMSYITAVMEAVTISAFPHYSFADFRTAVVVGSWLYALYFIVSYPMYARLDEPHWKTLTTFETAVDSLGATMIVTILLEVWRIAIGPIFGGSTTDGPPFVK